MRRKGRKGAGICLRQFSAICLGLRNGEEIASKGRLLAKEDSMLRGRGGLTSKRARLATKCHEKNHFRSTRNFDKV